jgi:hypothetical protein
MNLLLLVMKKNCSIFIYNGIKTLFGSFLFTSLLIFSSVDAQQVFDAQNDTDYKTKLTGRAAKIVNTLGFTDSTKYLRVLNELVNQYSAINAIHEKSNAAVSEINSKKAGSKEITEDVKKEEEKKSTVLLQQHESFIAHLKGELTDEQIEKVKDGMTYNVLNVTYTAYQNMILTLTAEQKETIYKLLTEAREKAMDEGSSEDKHKMFGKYKGRINNYLSSQGYDMKAEEKAWQHRLKEKQEKELDNKIN